MTINKVTFAGTIGYTASANLYKTCTYIFTGTALALATYTQDSYISAIILATAFLVVPQMIGVSRQLTRLAQKQPIEKDSPDIWVSVLEIQKLLLWAGFLFVGR